MVSSLYEFISCLTLILGKYTFFSGVLRITLLNFRCSRIDTQAGTRGHVPASYPGLPGKVRQYVVSHSEHW